MDNKYQKERVKLALLYFLILAFVVGIFSFITLHTQNQQFYRFDQIKKVVEKKQLPPGYYVDPEQFEAMDKAIAEIKAENLRNILILDFVLLIMASFFAYFLSGKTLEPILDTLNLQKRFVSDASHELKTPLTNIKTEAEVLTRSKKSTIEDYKEFTKNSIEDIDRLNELVTYLLDAARFETQKITLNKSKINTEKFLKNIVKKFEKKAEEKRIQFKVFGSIFSQSSTLKTENGKTVNTDPLILERLLSIILDNAIKYNKENGEIRIESGIEKDKNTIMIKDTGVGIHPDDLPQIFDRFYRVSGDRSEKGFGLGLAIARQLSIELDIDIEVESEVGKGTEFRLIFND